MNYFMFIALITGISLISGCAPRLPIEKHSRRVFRPSEPIFLESCPNEMSIIEIPFQTPKQSKNFIVLDAGHGGEDYGTHSLGTPKYQEKYLNLSTTQMVKGFLQQFGYTVLMTRNDDTFIPLDKRASFANERNSKLFVSIHYNSAPSKDAEGIEVYYYNDEENKTRTLKSKQLAKSILDKTLLNTQAKSRGVKHGNYAVIRETKMPAVLIEGGFLTSANEMEKIKDPAYLKKLALGIAQGIQEYLAKENVLAPIQRQQKGN